MSTLPIHSEGNFLARGQTMSRTSSGYKVFVGRIPSDARSRDLENFFKDHGFSKCIRDISMKSGFAFVVSTDALLVIYSRSFVPKFLIFALRV